mmetsp:Transcript_43965/g.116236  ORF Transcript_43965/g.116236 Transcript_43965/m.116236 type:complete len:100 (+) Transcript_43965:102-401(+)
MSGCGSCHDAPQRKLKETPSSMVQNDPLNRSTENSSLASGTDLANKTRPFQHPQVGDVHHQFTKKSWCLTPNHRSTRDAREDSETGTQDNTLRQAAKKT